MKDRFKYLLNWVDFLICRAILIRNKKENNVWNALEQIFINWNSSYLKSDDGKEFTNQTLENCFENIGVEHILG